jgi:hypothetical protein
VVVFEREFRKTSSLPVLHIKWAGLLLSSVQRHAAPRGTHHAHHTKPSKPRMSVNPLWSAAVWRMARAQRQAHTQKKKLARLLASESGGLRRDLLPPPSSPSLLPYLSLASWTQSHKPPGSFHTSGCPVSPCPVILFPWPYNASSSPSPPSQTSSTNTHITSSHPPHTHITQSHRHASLASFA